MNEEYRLLGFFIDILEKNTVYFGEKIEMTVNNWSILWCTQGEMAVVIEEQTSYILREYEGIWFNSGKKVKIICDNDKKITYNRIELGGEGIENIFLYFHFDYKNEEPVLIKGMKAATSIEKIKQYWSNRSYFGCSIEIQELLCTIGIMEKENESDEKLKKIHHFIEENYKMTIDINTLAEQMGTSSSYFMRKFKKIYGISPMTYVNELRLLHACECLAATDMKVQKISSECGFDKLEYFCYAFKKQYGFTPTQYRNYVKERNKQE